MPEPQEQKKVRVFGPDNKYYQFPTGTTKEAAVSYFKKKGITSPEAPEPKPFEGKKVDVEALSKNVKDAYSKLAPEEKSSSGRGVESSFGIDPQKMIKAFKEGKDIKGEAGPAGTVGGQPGKDVHLTGAHAQWAEMAEEVVDGLKHFGLSVLKDPLNAAQIIEAPARGIESGASKMIQGKPSEGAGELFGSLAQVLGGAEGVKKIHAHSTIVDGGIKAASDIAKATGKDVSEAVSTAHKATTDVPNRILRRRAFEDAYVHSKGLDVAKKIDKAARAVQEEVKTHAQGIAEQIDTKIPTGVVDATAEAATIMKEFQDVVKTPEKAHPVLVQMVKDAAATAPKLWSWEKARQFRSSVGRAMSGDKVVGPQKVVLTKVYIDLTKKLGGAAKQYGLEKSWNQYNELASKMDKEFSDITDGITDAKSGQEVAAKLNKDPALTNELSKNLSKYGLKHQEVAQYATTAKRIAAAKNFMNRSLFRLVYGSPPGLATAMSLRMSGAPYIAALGGGALVGLSTSYLVSLARILRLSPDIIESMMKERALPGKLKFEPGTFPSGEEPGAPQLPEPSGPSGPSEPITGEPESERIRRLGTGSKEAPRPTPEEIEAHKSSTEKSGLEKVEAAKKQLAERKTALVRHPSKEAGPAKAVTPEGQVVPERWYTDKGSIPGEPRQYLDVPGTDLDKAKAAIIEHESAKGTKYEAIDNEGKSLGTFDHAEQARAAAEAKYTKAEAGKHGTGKLAEQSKARERITKNRAVAKRTKEAQATEATARAQATHMDVSQLQIPEMEEYLQSKNPTALKGLIKMRKLGTPDVEYIEALKYLILEDLEK
jgi:hypothetical protein